MDNPVRFIEFPPDYEFRFIKIFGDTPRVKMVEFFIKTHMNSESGTPPWTYISQISRILALSKSSVKKIVDDMIEEKFITEKKITTHAKNPQRNVRINKENPFVPELADLYRRIGSI